MITYGLHPSLWREIRKNHSGGIEIDIKDRDNNTIGEGIVSRYDSVIHLDEKNRF